jgi:hypothetical protein
MTPTSRVVSECSITPTICSVSLVINYDSESVIRQSYVYNNSKQLYFLRRKYQTWLEKFTKKTTLLLTRKKVSNIFTSVFP